MGQEWMRRLVEEANKFIGDSGDDRDMQHGKCPHPWQTAGKGYTCIITGESNRVKGRLPCQHMGVTPPTTKECSERLSRIYSQRGARSANASASGRNPGRQRNRPTEDSL